MKVYVAGPMTGRPDWNRAAFEEAAERLRAAGHEVVTPVEEDVAIYGSFEAATERPWEEHLARDIALVASDRVEAVWCLPGWQVSKGALLEVRVAWTFGKPVFDYETTRELPPTAELRQKSESGGVKDNLGKARIDLIPTKPLVAVGDVLAYGAKKYAPHNWRLGLSWSDTYSSLQRHLLAFNDGEDTDPETGLPHLAHALCQLLFLAEYSMTGTGRDDRWSTFDREEARA